MTTPQSIETSNTSLMRDWLYAARYQFGTRRGVLILATLAIVAGIAFNWSWLVATGIAPILLTALPCVVMCGLGLCMNRLFGNSCATKTSSPSEVQGRTTGAAVPLRSATTNGLPACRDEAADKIAPSPSKQIETLEDRRNSHV